MAEHAPKLHQELTWIPQLSARSRRTCPTGMEGLVEASCASLQTSMRTRENSTCDHGDASRRRTDACQAAQRCTFASLFWPPSPPLAPSRFRGSGWMCHPPRAVHSLGPRGATRLRRATVNRRRMHMRTRRRTDSKEGSGRCYGTC